MTEPTHRSRRGRQAEAERNDRLVLEAAREIFATYGASAPIAAVADRAGVGVGSLYRRYGSKTELLRHLCVLAMEQAIDAAENALADNDVWTGLAGYVRACVAFGSGAFAPLAGTFDTTPQMRATSRRIRALAEEMVARAHRDGVLRPDVTALDIAWLVELFSRRGPARRTAEDDDIRRRLLAIALDGLRARDAPPLPGPPPTTEHYVARWTAPGPTPPALT